MTSSDILLERFIISDHCICLAVGMGKIREFIENDNLFYFYVFTGIIRVMG